MSISFRADSYQPQVNNKKNVFSVSPNAQEVLSKTNEYACGAQLANAVLEPENRKENLGKALTNAITMPIMSTTPISTVYTLNELQKGNISKQDAVKIMAYNSMAHALDV